jgi:endonuclease YncB( thermonuclease family)
LRLFRAVIYFSRSSTVRHKIEQIHRRPFYRHSLFVTHTLNVMARGFTIFALVSVLTIATLAQQSGVKASKVVRLRGNVLAVEDSDKVKLAADDGSVYSAMLAGIDAPDENQSYFKKAKKRLAELLNGKDVTVMLRTGDRDETFAIIYVGAEDIGLRMIQEGLAWYSPARAMVQNSADREKYRLAESTAKAAKSGLWSDKVPIAPWTFRGEKEPVDVADIPISPAAETPAPRSQPVPGRNYILGPRGGCYYLNDQGLKVYVKDKTLCQKPQ